MTADISDISGRIDLLGSASREAARQLEKSMTEMRANNFELILKYFRAEWNDKRDRQKE